MDFGPVVSIERLFDPSLALPFAAFGFAVAFGAGLLAGFVKLRFRVKTNYTRKLFHLLVFTFAGVAAFLGGLEAVLVYGGVATLYVLVAILLDGGNVLYEGVAREDDAPHRSLYILIPFLATAVGGLLGNVWFGPFAVVGYVVAGWGDAIGEPVGVRFGRHPYRVAGLFGAARRTVEGSIAILLVSFVAVHVAAVFALSLPWNAALVPSAATAAGVTIVEAVSPRGLDNSTIQLVSTAVAAFLLGGV